MANNGWIQNAHLEGGPFFWEAGEIGVLLCHGFTATAAEVRPLASILHAHGYTVAAPLLPGHGTTPEAMNRCRWQDWAAAVDALYLNLQRRCRLVVLGGESMGALLCINLAVSHPEIAGLLIYAPALRVPSALTPLLAPLLATFIPYRPKPVGAPSPADDRWQGYTVQPVPAAVQLFRLQRTVRRQLPSIQHPLLVVHGRRDASVHPAAPVRIYREARSRIKDLHWMKDSGHCVILDGELEQVGVLSLNFLKLITSFPNSSKG